MLSFFFTTICLLLTQPTLSLRLYNPHRLLTLVLTESPDTLVNTYTTDKQYLPTSTTFPDGTVLVAWQSLNQGPNNDEIYAQKFDFDSTPSGVEFRVDRSSTESQTVSTITALNNGKYVVAYQSTLLAGGTVGHFAQVYNVDGTEYGSRYRVNTYSTNNPQPTMTSLSDGKYVIVWRRDGVGGGGFGIYAQIFNIDGTTFGSEFKVSTYASGNQARPAVAGLADGKFVVVWQSSGQDTSSLGIFGQIFNNAGTAIGVEFQVNTYITSDQSFPKVAGLKNGGFVVTWQSSGQDTNNYGIYAQMYTNNGATYNTEFKVNNYITNGQQYPAVTGLISGGFVIVWQSNGQDTSGNGIYGQKYHTDGSRFESEFRVNTYTTGEQSSPTVVPIGNGFVVIWQSDAQDGNDLGIFAKWFTCPSETPNFFDNQCYEICPTTAPYSYNDGCYEACPTVALNIYNWKCYTTCPSVAPNLFGNQCYETCPTTAPYLYNKECYQTCPTVAPNIYNWGCYTTCPSTASNLFNNQCYETCPVAAPYLYNKGCYQTCPAVAPNIYNWECYTTCPSVAPNVNSTNNCYSDPPVEVYEGKWTNGMNFFTEIALKFFSAIDSSSPNYVLIASFSSMLLYIRYLRIDYTWPVRIMFKNQEIINVSFGIDVPESVEDGLTRQPLPDVFTQYDVHSSFLFNLWDTLISGLIILFVTLVIILLTKLTKKKPKVNSVFKILLNVAKWNLPLLLLCGNFNKTIVYACLEMKSLDFDSAGAVMSFLICLLFLGLCLYVLVKMLIIARNIMQSQQNPALKRDWTEYTILYEGYKNTSYFTLGYLPIFYLRNLILDLLITTAYASPLFQTVLMVFMSTAMLIYLAWFRPLKNILQMLQLCVNEILLLALNICVLIIASLDKQKSGNADTRDNLGEAIIILNMLFSTSNVVFIALESFKWIIVLRRRIKAGKARGLTSFVQILKFIFLPTSGLEHSVSIVKSATIVPSNFNSVIKPEHVDSSRVQFVKTDQDYASGNTSASKLELIVRRNSSIMKNLEEARQTFKPLNVSEVSLLSKTLQQDKPEVTTINLPEKEVENKNKLEEISLRDLTENNKSFELNSMVGKEIQAKLGQRVESEVFEYTSKKRRRHAKSDASEALEDGSIRKSSLGYYI